MSHYQNPGHLLRGSGDAARRSAQTGGSAAARGRQRARHPGGAARLRHPAHPDAPPQGPRLRHCRLPAVRVGGLGYAVWRQGFPRDTGSGGITRAAVRLVLDIRRGTARAPTPELPEITTGGSAAASLVRYRRTEAKAPWRPACGTRVPGPVAPQPVERSNRRALAGAGDAASSPSRIALVGTVLAARGASSYSPRQPS